MDLSKLKEIIGAIHDRYEIKPSFTEKDVYITAVLKAICDIDHDKIIPVFAGGTALHKGHKVIKRFSEDIDFRAKFKSPVGRGARSDYRKCIIAKINEIPGLKVIDESIVSYNHKEDGNYFSFNIEYPKTYSLDGSLRDNLMFELHFDELLLDTVECEVESIVDSLTKKPGKNFKINCISLEETAGNKLSALMWRVQIKDRTQPLGRLRNDPTIVRHLHDLSALKNKTLNDNFLFVLDKSFNADLGRGGSSKDLSLKDSIKNTLVSLRSDKVYNKEYEDFARNMCYGMTKDFIGFEKAIEDLEEIAEFVFSK